MVLPIYGISKKMIHHEKVAYTHACGNVQPGDGFSENMLEVNCKECKKERHYFRTPENTKFPDNRFYATCGEYMTHSNHLHGRECVCAVCKQERDSEAFHGVVEMVNPKNPHWKRRMKMKMLMLTCLLCGDDLNYQVMEGTLKVRPCKCQTFKYSPQKKVSYCAKHDTYPEPGEPCWACANPFIQEALEVGQRTSEE